MRFTLVFFLLASLWPAAGAGQEEGRGEPLRLRPGDAVRLNVQNEPQLGADYPVVEDGTVLLPLVGSFRVAGRPFPEARDEIVAAFDVELVGSTVVVTPILRIPVLGAVRQPGLIPVDPTYTIAEVLASAGGLAPDGDPGRLRLMRDGRTMTLHVESAAASGIRLLPGDQIVVGERSWIRRNAPVVLSVVGSVVTAVLTSLILR